MAYVLDLNRSNDYTLELTLMDKDHTTLLVGLPTEAMEQELSCFSENLHKLAKGDKESIELVYDLAARLISRNRNFITVTAEELRTKYRMDLESAILFFSAYLDFLSKVTNEKN